ncbi:MAG: MaoC family dehydratase N-terminal domain-containing protein [Actinobacteria bacterium]|nr:MaoC family dehydratase N-terminal domain-containing protein [Actinomycetota bacterium]
MLHPDSVGRTFLGANPVTVTQEDISAFALAIGEEDVSVAPPTFSICISLAQSQAILSAPEVGLDWTRLVHGDQRFELRRPIVAGDVLNCDSTIESYKVIAGNEILTVRSDLASKGKLVASSWSTLVVRA